MIGMGRSAGLALRSASGTAAGNRSTNAMSTLYQIGASLVALGSWYSFPRANWRKPVPRPVACWQRWRASDAD